jgi:Ran GTPase-activating protein (RanGAP) involved in mRNA processing and transport
MDLFDCFVEPQFKGKILTIEQAIDLSNIESLMLKPFQLCTLEPDKLEIANALFRREKRLKKLYAGNSSLSGAGLSYICDALAESPELEEINFFFSRLDDEAFIYIADIVRRNRNLRKIFLEMNRASDAGFIAFFDAICVNSSITALDISQNYIGTEGIQSLARMIEHNKSLYYLSISSVYLHDCGLSNLSIALTTHTCITILNLSSNELDHLDCSLLGDILLYNKYIKELDISDNNINAEGCKLICKSLIKNESLKKLNIARNNLGYPSAFHIYDFLSSNSPLEEIDLSCNEFGTDGCEIISKSLYSNSSISSFNFSENAIHDEGALILCKVFSKNSSLKNLFVNDKSVGFIGMCHLINAAKQSSGALFLRIDACEGLANTLSIEAIFEKCNSDPSFLFDQSSNLHHSYYLSQFLKDCHQLSQLQLENNNISDKILAESIDALATHNRIESISIAGNMGSKNFFCSIFQVMDSLSLLDVSKNAISDEDCFLLSQYISSGNCALVNLNISNNHISESSSSALFRSLTKINRCFKLNMRYCKLNSECIKNLHELFDLNQVSEFKIDLSDNEITSSELLVKLSWSLSKGNPSSTIDLRNNPLKRYENGINYISLCHSEGLNMMKLRMLEVEESKFFLDAFGLDTSISCVLIEPSSIYIEAPPEELQISFFPDHNPIIGKGSFAIVYDCFCDGFYQRNLETVLKALYPVDPASTRQVIRELEIWNTLSHQNVVKFYGIVKPDNSLLNSDSTELKFLLEKCDHVLHEYLMRISNSYPGLETILKLALDIARGMEYVHDQRIIHLDLHSNNILVTTEKIGGARNASDPYFAKITDFGLSRRAEEVRDNPSPVSKLSSNTVMCRHIMAPEADDDYAIVGLKTDVYSFGIILWEMLTLHNVIEWASSNPRDLLGEVIVSSIIGKSKDDWLNAWSEPFSPLPIQSFQLGFSKKDQASLDQMFSLCISCLNKTPDSRPSFTDIYAQINDLISK